MIRNLRKCLSKMKIIYTVKRSIHVLNGIGESEISIIIIIIKIKWIIKSNLNQILRLEILEQKLNEVIEGIDRRN